MKQTYIFLYHPSLVLGSLSKMVYTINCLLEFCHGSCLIMYIGFSKILITYLRFSKILS